MDMWKPFRKSTQAHAPQAAILFDKFHIVKHLSDALDEVRIPTKPAMHSNMKPATYSDLKPASVPI
jgi:transposase